MKRWIKLTLYIISAVMLVIVCGMIYMLKLGGLESFVNDRIDRAIRGQHDIDINVGNIAGNGFSDLILEDVSIFSGDSANRRLTIYIPRLSGGYSWRTLLSGKFYFDFINIDSAAIVLEKDSTGRMVLPQFVTGQAKGEKAPLAFHIDALTISSARLTLHSKDDTTRIERINLSSALDAEAGTFSSDLSHLEFTYEMKTDTFDITAAGGKVTYASGVVVFKNVSLLKDQTRMKLNGNVRLTGILGGSIEFAVDQLDVAEISKYLPPDLRGTLDLNGVVDFDGSEISGSVHMAGNFMIAEFRNLFVDFHYSDKVLTLDTLYGTIFDRCGIEGSGGIEFTGPAEKYWLDGYVQNFNLDALIPGTFQSNITGSLFLDGHSLREKTMKLDFDLDVYESSFDEYPLQHAAGHLTVTTDSIVFADSFMVSYYENIFYASGTVDYDSTMELAVEVDLRNLDRYVGKLFIDKPGGRARAIGRISGRTSDPDLYGRLTSDSIWIYGWYTDTMVATANIDRFLTGMDGTVKIDAGSGNLWGIPIDSAAARLTTDSVLVMIDTVGFGNEYSQVVSRGVFDFSAERMRLDLDTVLLRVFDRLFSNQSSVKFAFDSLGIELTQVSLGNSESILTSTGRVNYDETMDFQLSVGRAPVAPWLGLFDTTYGIDGVLSGRAVVNGTMRYPAFTAIVSVDSLSYRGLILGHLSGSGIYRDRLMTIDSLIIKSNPGIYRATGQLYTDLAFTDDAIERFPDLPINIHFEATDQRFDLVSLVLPSVEQLDGNFLADFVLTGTPTAPHLAGEAYITDAALKYFDLENTLYSDSAGVTMINNRIDVERITVYTYDQENGDNKRYAYIEGELIVRTLDNFYYSIDVNIPHRFPFIYSLEDVKGVAEGKLHVEGETPPTVTGDIVLRSTRYRAEFADGDVGWGVTAALFSEDTWDLDLNIDIPSNYFIQNQDIDAEFAGQINMLREDGNYRFIGEMEVLRGRGFLFDKTWQLESGGRVFFEGKDTLNPALEIRAYTRIPGYRSATADAEQTPEPIDVCVDISGTLETPEITPCPESEITREELLPAIVANYYESGTRSASGQLEQRLTDLISAQVSQLGTRQLSQLGVETFEIDPTYGGEVDPLKTRVTLGFYTSPNLYVYGRSTLSGESGQEVGFEYRFNKNLLLQGRRNEEELYRLGLRLHTEF